MSKVQRKSPLERFQSFVYPEPNTGCWLWGGSLADGYGLISVQGVLLVAHRFSYREFVGLIPSGSIVCHRCDVPSCVNPDHLFLGTQSDNIIDCVNKGRFKPGGHKLTTSQVLEIRASNLSNANLSKLFNISCSNIKKIRLRKIWKRI